MELEFREYDGSIAALNPRIERSGDQLMMKLNEHGCDYFLVLSRIPGGYVDLHDMQIREELLKKQDFLPTVQDEPLTEEIAFSCVEWSDYRVNDYAIDLPNRIAEYTVVGCREEEGRLVVFMPEEGMSCSAKVSLTVSYRLVMISGEVSRRPFAKAAMQQSFYVAEFDDIPNYQDGEIVYTLEGSQWKYPITREMLGKKKLFIEAGCGIPKFSTAVSGLELKKV